MRGREPLQGCPQPAVRNQDGALPGRRPEGGPCRHDCRGSERRQRLSRPITLQRILRVWIIDRTDSGRPRGGRLRRPCQENGHCRTPQMFLANFRTVPNLYCQSFFVRYLSYHSAQFPCPQLEGVRQFREIPVTIWRPPTGSSFGRSQHPSAPAAIAPPRKEGGSSGSGSSRSS
jgi:hypothetical protein